MTATMTVPIRQAAQRLGVHENTIRNWADRELIACLRLPTGVRRIPEAEVARLEREMFAVPTSLAPDVTAAPRQLDQSDEAITVYPS